MINRWFFLIFGMLLAFLQPVHADSNTTQSPIQVVELFTSQGCHSCPPADELLGELAQRQGVIALSCHVTYWNYLGWRDTFSRSFCDDRQRSYQAVLQGGQKGVYTPQMIINGRYAGVGSRHSIIEQILEFDQKQSPVRPIGLAIRGGSLEVTLPELSKGLVSTKPQLFLLGTSGKHILPIDSGENSGKRLPYYHPVEYSKLLDRWDGQARQISVALPNEPAIKDWLVIAQLSPIGEFVAAGKIAAN